MPAGAGRGSAAPRRWGATDPAPVARESTATNAVYAERSPWRRATSRTSGSSSKPWGEVSARLSEKAAKGDWAGMGREITDEMLDVYAVTATWKDLPGVLVKKYRGVAGRLIFYFANEAWERGPAYLARWRDVLARTRALLAER